MFIGYKAIAQGSDHTRNGENIPCQDAASFSVIEFGKDTSKSAAIAVVADGHGSPAYFRSAMGSSYAVDITKAVISEHLIDNKDEMVIEKSLKNLENVIVHRWQEAINEHFSKNPITLDEQKHCQKHGINSNPTANEIAIMYGTTLVAAVIAKNFWFTIQLGDGWCVVFDQGGKGTGASPYRHNDDSRTDSLCMPNASNQFQHHFGLEKIGGALVMTDGVTESFSEDPQTNEELLLDWLNNTVFSFFIEEPHLFEEELQWVIKKRAKKWGDDGSLAGVFDYGIAATLLVEHELKAKAEITQTKNEAMLTMVNTIKRVRFNERG